LLANFSPDFGATGTPLAFAQSNFCKGKAKQRGALNSVLL